MFIEIDETILNEVDEIEDPVDHRIIIINALFDSMMKNKHIVYCNRDGLAMIRDNQCFSPYIREYVRWVLKEYVQIYSCKSLVKTRVLVKNGIDHVEYSEGLISVPLSCFFSVNESKLLTEHESDAKFYLNIARFIKEKKKLSNYYGVCFENDSYHGANGPAKLEQLAEATTKKLVLCIVDSDKEYPQGSKGATFIGINNKYKKIKKRLPIELFALKVREKENLIPATIYCNFSDCELISLIASEFPDDEVIADFFDIKDGIKYKKLVNEDSRWTGAYGDLLTECIVRNPLPDQIEEEDFDKVYLSGIGDKLCDRVATALFSNGDATWKDEFSFPSAQIEKIETEIPQMLGFLPKNVLSHWEELFSIIFAWGCCVSKEKYPAIRDWT